MKYVDCFRYLASQRTNQLVVTSAGNSGQAWWAATRDTHGSFYLGASMSLSTMFASGIAKALPQVKIWAFMGDGAFCMNPGMLFVERQMNLPNLTHFVVSNQCYGGTGNSVLPNRKDHNDYAGIARAMGLERIFSFDSLESLKQGFPQVISGNAPGHTFVVLEVEQFTPEEERLPIPEMDGPEMKYRFGRHIEQLAGADIFGYRV
jgi:sulfopyruvate decarboxylase subunit beta